MSAEADLRESLALHGRSLYERGLRPGTSGNLSVRFDDGLLVTPTGSCLGRLDSARISYDAVAAMEEQETAAPLFFLLQGSPTRLLTGEQVNDLEQAFPS